MLYCHLHQIEVCAVSFSALYGTDLGIDARDFVESWTALCRRYGR